MSPALEAGEGGEFDARGGGSIVQRAWERGRSLSQQYVKVTCLTHKHGIRGRGEWVVGHSGVGSER